MCLCTWVCSCSLFVCVCVCVNGVSCSIFLPVLICFCVCLHYGLCYSQQGIQVDTVTVPHRATEGPCRPTTEALSPCSSWLVIDFLLSFYSLPLSLTLFPFFSEPIFLSEVLIWGAGQWGQGTERGDRGREGREGRRGVGGGAEEVRSGDGCRRTALCSSFPRLLSWASEAPVALEPSRERGRETERKTRGREALEEKGGTMICPTGIFKYHMRAHTRKWCGDEKGEEERKGINQKIIKREQIE